MSRVETEMVGVFREVLLIEGPVLPNLLRKTKGLYLLVGYRSETPRRENAAGGILLRQFVVGMSIMLVSKGRTASTAEATKLNDTMDTLLEVMTDSSKSSKWWGSDADVCGVESERITALSSQDGDYVGRDMLFNVLVM
jgi:hypothetical protein